MLVFNAKTLEDLKEIDEFEAKSVNAYFESKSLHTNEQIKQFLKMRLFILLKSYEKQNVISEPKCTNELFIKRLIESEQKLIKKFYDFLNK